MKNQKFCFLSLLVLSVLCLLTLCKSSSSSREDGFVRMKSSTTLLGGVRDYNGNRNDGEIESLGRFAVQEHNKKENAFLEYARVIKAKEQVVAGKIYHLTLEAIEAGKRRIYEAKVWTKPWMKFKQLEEFKLVYEIPSFSSADLGEN